MFGAVGLYRDDIFFGIISDGTLYFKVDDTNRGEYVSRHMPQFRPYRDRPERSMAYYEVPADVLEDPEACVAWALRAVAAAANRAISPKRPTTAKRASAAPKKTVKRSR
jgi:DNA transformation protein